MTTRQTAKAQNHRQQIKSFPAPAQLATATDLTSKEVQAITEALNPLVADLFALYVKTKNFHWHLAGSHFRDYHLLLDEHADQIFAAIDILAERVRRLGGTTIRSISHIGQAQAQRAAHEVCDKNRDVATTSLLEITIDEAERRKWFLFEVVQGASNAE